MTKAKNGTRKAKAKGANVLEVEGREGEEREATMARLSLDPGLRHAAVSSNYADGLFGGSQELPIKTRVAVLGTAMAKARSGDKDFASEMLAAQAMVLDAMFTELANRAAANMGRYQEATERYGKLALKAQANCRATLEALAKLHQPREQTVKHVHVNEGGQAVVADQFHHHQGGGQNGKSNEQPHATGAAGKSAALPCEDAEGNGLPIPSGEGQEKVPDARRDQPRRT